MLRLGIYASIRSDNLEMNKKAVKTVTLTTLRLAPRLKVRSGPIRESHKGQQRDTVLPVSKLVCQHDFSPHHNREAQAQSVMN